MLNNADKKRYSYCNLDSRHSCFIHKNFNKTCSYHTNFSHSKFINVSLIGAKFKFSSLFGAEFDNCYIRGALFRRCNLQNCTFRNCIISSTIFERCKVKNCFFENCKILHVKLPQSIKYSESTKIFENYPRVSQFKAELCYEIEQLRRNRFIRRSSVLHLKKDRIETISLSVLVEVFGEDFLIYHLKDVNKFINREFSSLSYIINILKKIQSCNNIERPGSAAP